MRVARQLGKNLQQFKVLLLPKNPTPLIALKPAFAHLQHFFYFARHCEFLSLDRERVDCDEFEDNCLLGLRVSGELHAVVAEKLPPRKHLVPHTPQLLQLYMVCLFFHIISWF